MEKQKLYTANWTVRNDNQDCINYRKYGIVSMQFSNNELYFEYDNISPIAGITFPIIGGILQSLTLTEEG